MSKYVDSHPFAVIVSTYHRTRLILLRSQPHLHEGSCETIGVWRGSLLRENDLRVYLGLTAAILYLTMTVPEQLWLVSSLSFQHGFLAYKEKALKC